MELKSMKSDDLVNGILGARFGDWILKLVIILIEKPSKRFR